MNQVQMGVITTGPFDTFDPIVRSIDYPFIFKDNEQARFWTAPWERKS